MVILPVAHAEELNLVYDANGNLITGDGKYRVYNNFNQLIKVYSGNTSSGDLMEEYIYHPVEERILVKRIYRDTFNDPKEVIVYFNDNYVKHYSNLHGTAFINDSHYAKDEMGIAGEIVTQEIELTEGFTTEATLFYHNDHLGSTSVVTNGSQDLITETFYEPFGGIISGGTTRYDYEGKEYSSNTEDFDFHFRKYDPHIARFTQPDTLIQNVYDPQSLNRYAFERNNPYKYVDADGHIAITTLVLIATIAAVVISGGVMSYKVATGQATATDVAVFVGLGAVTALTGGIIPAIAAGVELSYMLTTASVALDAHSMITEEETSEEEDTDKSKVKTFEVYEVYHNQGVQTLTTSQPSQSSITSVSNIFSTIGNSLKSYVRYVSKITGNILDWYGKPTEGPKGDEYEKVGGSSGGGGGGRVRGGWDYVPPDDKGGGDYWKQKGW